MKLIDLRNYILKDSRGQREIARLIDVKSKSTVSNFIKYFEVGKPEPSVKTVLKLYMLYGNNKQDLELLEDYGLVYIAKSSNLKELMDYCLEKNMFQLVGKLSDKGKGMKYPTLQIAMIYGLIAKAKLKENGVTWGDIYVESVNINCSNPQVLFLKNYVKALYLLNAQNFDGISERYLKLKNVCLSMLENIEDQKKILMYTKFKPRVNELLIRALVKLKDYAKVRKIAQEIINSEVGTRHKASAHYALGSSYLYENKDKCISHLEMSSKLYFECGMFTDSNHAQFQVEFSSIYWGETVGLEPISPINQAFLLATIGKMDEAKIKLGKETEYDGYNAVFVRIVRALIEPSEMIEHDLLNQARVQFEMWGDTHFADLPYKVFNRHKASKEVYR
ncbi:AimR family lysis-lysogeny pheromone receptor [Cytobacillus sp. Hm23]